MFHQELLDAGFVERGEVYAYDFSIFGINVVEVDGRLEAEFQCEYDHEGDRYERVFDSVEEMVRDFHGWCL